MVSELKIEHIPPIVDLCNQVFGENYITLNSLTQYLKSSSKNCYVYLNDNNVNGFITYETFNYQDFTKKILKDGSSFTSNIEKYKNISIIKQIVVNPKYRKKGLASLLLKTTLDELSFSTNIIYCFSWKKNDAVSLKNILERVNFELVATIKNYWEQDSLTHQYNCSFCGSPPCRCSTDVYIKKMPSIT